MRTLRRIAVFAGGMILIMVSLFAAAYATDGIIQLNQGMAIAGNILPGDTPGFPIVITQSGSYRLTSDLTLPDANTRGIEIQADNVTIDLNGFTLAGPTTCTGAPPSLTCSPLGSGSGIYSVRSRIAIRNGIIQGTGGHGIDLGSGAAPGTNHVVDGITVANSGMGDVFHGGIFVGPNSIVRNCILERNPGYGIRALNNSQIMFNVSKENQRNGIFAETGSGITHNDASGNGTYGVSGGDAVLVEDNTVIGGTGIAVGAGALVSRNTIRSSTFTAIALGLNSVASRNILTLNAMGIGLGSGGITALDNFCDGAGC